MNELTAKDVEDFFAKWREGEYEVENYSEYWDFWWVASEGKTITLGDLGEFLIQEAEVGKAGTINYEDYASTWDNWIILTQNRRHFRLSGQYDSWDASGWDGNVEEVEKVATTVYVWEKKLDY